MSEHNGTTSLDDLPISKQINENIKLDIKEKNVIIDNPPSNINTIKKDNDIPKMVIDQNKLISDIQQASASGMLHLPSRDIPLSQEHITHDSLIKANYVPKDSNDYIKQHQTPEEIIQKNAQREKNNNTIDEYYNEFQIPIMICVLYFLFHLPVVRKIMLNYLPSLFNKDGNLNGSGYVANSIIFAGICYFVFKSINFLSI